jgi:hypothetical protein
MSKKHLPFIVGLKLISINSPASSLSTTLLISSTSLQANLMQVCHIKLMIDGSVRMSFGGFGGIDDILILVV